MVFALNIRSCLCCGQGKRTSFNRSNRKQVYECQVVLGDARSFKEMPRNGEKETGFLQLRKFKIQKFTISEHRKMFKNKMGVNYELTAWSKELLGVSKKGSGSDREWISLIRLLGLGCLLWFAFLVYSW